tara:strand:- start:139 stop:282 length:144 start_codon:yes stop_codon:yes gene_type:complete
MINQTKEFKQKFPSDSETHKGLYEIELILVDTFDKMIFNSNSYNDNN